MTNKKCVVLFSGGLDSRLAVKIMQERGFQVLAVHFNLPFGCGCCDFGCNFKFTQMSDVEFKIFDCAKGKLLEEYLEVLKKGKHGRGVGFNPCKDCKIWMFKKAKEYADKLNISIIATGEVLGQRPMSQTKKAMKIIDDEVGFGLTRPLIELGIEGRRRDKQMALAKKYKIRYPNPGGGCLLCEKVLKNRFKFLIENNLLNEKNIFLVNVGRHFNIGGNWIILGRDEKENKIIEKFKEGKLIVPGYPAPSVLIFGKINKSIIDKVNELIRSYSKRGSLKERETFEGEKL